MRIVSVNRASAEKIGGKGTPKFYAAKTGSFKKPVEGLVFVGSEGLEGDFIGDPKHHGGKDQAVYIYSVDDYAYWKDELGEPCAPGLFGENLTVEGLKSSEALVGDHYQFGDVLLEVTSPRMPCSTMAARMNDTNFVKRFMKSKRPGVYCRVLREGTLTAGQTGTRERFSGPEVTLLELFVEYPHKSVSEEQRNRYLAVPAHWKLHAFLNGEINKI